MTPDARQDGLLVQEVGDETIVYDQQRNHAHRLNRSAALVWRACNGRRTVADLADTLRPQLGDAASEDLVLLALDRLEKGHLLTGPLDPPMGVDPITRRTALRKLALVGGMTLLIPVVQNMVAPTPAMAMSVGCAKNGQIYSATRPCCPGLRRRGNRCVGHV